LQHLQFRLGPLQRLRTLSPASRTPAEMLFNSHEFILLFLPLALAAHFLVARFSTVAAVLTTTVSSLLFYAWWKPPFVALPISSILLNFWLAQEILRTPQPRRKYLAVAGAAANLLVLGYFKYFDFLVAIFAHRPPTPPDVPLALSFTTFVQIAFLIELSRRPTVVSLPKYAMFVSFFPHLIAGPIVRWSELGSAGALRRARVRCGRGRPGGHRGGRMGRIDRLLAPALLRLLRIFGHGRRAWPAL
jgi:hypothetical protein